MIVLDEQLLGGELDHAIATWYRGSVQFVTTLRPHTVIKDEAIPVLLEELRQPTFVTINERDFWQRVAITLSFVLCALHWTIRELETSRCYYVELCNILYFGPKLNEWAMCCV